MVDSSRLIAVLGIDGSGKSTVSRHVAARLSEAHRVGLVGDTCTLYQQGIPGPAKRPVVEHLRHRILFAAKHAKSLRGYKIPKLADLFLRDRLIHVMAKRDQPASIVTDGSPLLNMIAWTSLYKDEILPEELCAEAIGVLTGVDVPRDERHPLFAAFPELLVIARIGLNRLTLPDYCLFLDVDPAVACRRIRKRGEPMQVHENEDSLARLRRAYLEVCKAARRAGSARVSILDANRDMDQVLVDVGRALETDNECAH